MVRRTVREHLRDDVSIWFMDGIIDAHARDALLERYDARRLGWIGVIKYIGIVGGLQAFLGIVGMFAAMTESLVVGAIVTALVGAAFTAWGIRLTGGVRDDYATSAKIVLTLGMVLWVGAVGLFLTTMGIEDAALALTMGVVCLPLCFVLAYRYRNTYVLILSLLGGFHWVGAWHAMVGHSTYAFALQDPKTMSLVALGAVGVGIYHERWLYPRTGRFYRVWESLGLFYLNMALLILTIAVTPTSQRIVWIVVFSLSGIVQIALGAAWHNGLIGGFGIVFYCINIFTRYHELFWDHIGAGWFFLLGGSVLFAVGAAVEFGVRRHRLARGRT